MPTYRVSVRQEFEVTGRTPREAVDRALERATKARVYRRDIWEVHEVVPSAPILQPVASPEWAIEDLPEMMIEAEA